MAEVAVVVALELEEGLERAVAIAARSHPLSREYAGADNGGDCSCFVADGNCCVEKRRPSFSIPNPA